jgi:integrase
MGFEPTTKNGERRSIPMNDVLTATLLPAKMEVSEGNAVFRTPQGGPYRNFRTAFEHAVQRAGLEDVTFHDLRHTFASRLVMVRVDLPTVKELLGHKSIAMTLRYTHLSTDHKQRAVSALEQFGGKVGYPRKAGHPTLSTTARHDLIALPRSRQVFDLR